MRRRQRCSGVDVDGSSHPHDVTGETSRQQSDILIGGQCDNREITTVDDLPTLYRSGHCEDTCSLAVVGVQNDRNGHRSGDDE